MKTTSCAPTAGTRYYEFVIVKKASCDSSGQDGGLHAICAFKNAIILSQTLLDRRVICGIAFVGEGMRHIIAVDLVRDAGSL